MKDLELQKTRLESCVDALIQLGIDITYCDETRLEFIHKGHLVKFFPYTGWHTGKSIVDGRGFKHLTNQLK